MILELSGLKRAVESLERAVETTASPEAEALSERAREVLRAGVIQNFEFTYELCWKFIKRWLERNIGATYVDGVTRRELFRRGAENALIDDVDGWMDYHHARNETSHTYNQDTAEEVFEHAKRFLGDAKALLAILEKKND